MSRRVRLHVNPLRLDHQAPAGARVAIPSGRAPVEVEVGCADAELLFARAAALAAGFFVGVEIRDELVAQVNARARGEGVANLLAVHANANVALGALFAPASVDRFHLSFPDPWFKRRQQKRRLVSAALARALAGALRPGGEVFFQSDVFDLALDAMAVFEEEAGLRNLAGPWSFVRANPFGARSRRERTVEERGLRVWRMRYVRT